MENNKNLLCLQYFSSHDFAKFIIIPRATAKQMTYTKESHRIKATTRATYNRRQEWGK
jgi:hypothetical protein